MTMKCTPLSWLFGSGYRGVCKEFPRFRKELFFSQMMFVHDQRSNDPFGQFRAAALQPVNELVHFAAHARAGAENQDFSNPIQQSRHRLKETVGIRLFLTTGKLLRDRKSTRLNSS